MLSTQLPEKPRVLNIARLYANAFAGEPWNEYKVCPNGKYYGRGVDICTICNQALKLAYPEEETAEYISKEVARSEGTLITYEENGEVLAAGWGYACTVEELQAKYKSDEMKAMIATVIKVQNVFYLSEIMVDERAQRQGLATRISQELAKKATKLSLNLVMRTNIKSPMVRIADKMQMEQIISKDLDNPERILYMRKC